MNFKAHLIQQMNGLMAIDQGFLQSFAGGITAMTFEPPREQAEKPELISTDGVAVIDIEGMLIRSAPDWASEFGVASMEGIAARIREAAANEDVHGIFLNIDSPGGSVNGTEELAAAIANAATIKPVRAFSSGMMASAAYWIGSQADDIIVTPSAIIGSIGVMGVHIDASQQHAAEGVRVQVFTSGEMKAPGAMETALTPAQVEHMEQTISEMALKFYSAVLTARGEMDDLFFDGRTVQGSEAVAANLADSVALSMAEAMNLK
jgi:signal peptide peptidase SppA